MGRARVFARLTLSALTLALIPTLARAQEPVPAQATPPQVAPEPQAADELVSIEVLEATLRPMTQGQVQAELDDWLAGKDAGATIDSVS